MALTGTLVSQSYASGVRDALAADHALQWHARLADPQILIDRATQGSLVGELTRAGHNGALLLEAARESLVSAIHLGIAMAAVVAVYAVWQCRRVPPVTLRRAVEPHVAVD